MTPPSYEVVVVGAGQAGLAIGHLLRGQGRRFTILERAHEIAPAWRERWNSLTLFTPRRCSALPGVPFPGDPDGYPTRDEVIAYLESGTALVDPHSADQLVLPLALAEGPSEYRVSAVTRHLTTNIAVIRRFLDRDIVCEGEAGAPGVVRVR